MDITIGNKSVGRVVILLRADAVPKTAGALFFLHLFVFNEQF